MSDAVHPPKHTNRLARESSPYLLQHAHNPVDWFPWGPEAFEIARRENKPIFLSVGYSTCYWCHVMERQCFEVEAVAAEMNQRFVNIKVDREERPDVDQLYMTAVQVLTRHGGWPMSVFLTPDLRPFYGGTYFPPTDAHGRPGFVTLLRGLEDAYRNRPADVKTTADRLVNILGQYAEPSAPDTPIVLDDAFIEGLIRRSVSDYDPKAGGFGGAPKFPRETLLELLLVYIQTAAPASFKSHLRQMLRHTLDAMADGGIRDHLGGGFHRYSTDDKWLVPHFEIMLYDNAMLGWCYAEAFRQLKDERFATVACGIFDFILREMTSPEGAFYTALDAEVDSQEGLNYLWTAAEITTLLSPTDAAIFNKIYGVDAGPNFADPHHGNGVAEKNILYLPRPLEEVAEEMNADPAFADLRRHVATANSGSLSPVLGGEGWGEGPEVELRPLPHGPSSQPSPPSTGEKEPEPTQHHFGHADVGSALRTRISGVMKSPETRSAARADEQSAASNTAKSVHGADPTLITPAGLDRYLAPLRQKLYAARMKRKQPLLDTKIITSWNALMIRALAHGGTVLAEPRYTSAAARAADYLLASHGKPDGGLYRTSRDGHGKYDGFIDDYAFLIQALLAVADGIPDTTAGPYRQAASDLAAVMNQKFADPDLGGYYFTEAGAQDLIIRQKTASDSPLPSGNAIAAITLLELGDGDHAQATIASFAAAIESHGEGMSSMVQAALLYVRKAGAFQVSSVATVPSLRPATLQQTVADAVAIRVEWRSATELLVHLRIADGFHINAHQVPTDPPLVPTTITIPDDPAATVDYPPAQEFQTEFAQNPLPVYGGEVTFVVKFSAARPVDSTISLNVTYQACNESTCLLPVTKQIPAHWQPAKYRT